MGTNAEKPTDPLDTVRTWLAAGGSAGMTLAAADIGVLGLVVAELDQARCGMDNVAAWLRARAEIAIAQKDDPEQPGHEDFSKGWRGGAYNSLHTAANAVEDGRASLPRQLWPAYMRGETVGPPEQQTKEITDGPTDASQ